MKEKKLTDEVVAKNAITDEDIRLIRLDMIAQKASSDFEHVACVPKSRIDKWIAFIENMNNELKKELTEHEEFTKKAKEEIERLTEVKEEVKQLKEYIAVLKGESEKLKQSCAEAVNSFIRMETLYKIKCQELEIANKKLEELKGGKID